MKEDCDRKIKTPNKDMVMCGVDVPLTPSIDTEVTLKLRHGKKKDEMSLMEFLYQIYGRPVKIMFL